MTDARPPALSLALIVRNEARCLARCLLSVRSVVQEMLVVDTGSTDDTVRIARDCGARVETFAWVDDFAAARNHALGLARGEWILMLDADEWASEALAAEIPGFVAAGPAVGRLKIVSDFRRGGQLLKSHAHVARLFPRGARFEGRIHEQLVSPLPRVNLRGELWHDGYLTTSKSTRNVTLLARELEAAPGEPYLLFQLALEHTALGEAGRSAELLARALDRLDGGEPFAANVVVDLLYALMELGRLEEGAAVLVRGARFAEASPDFHLAAGLFLMNLVRSNPSAHIARLPEIEQRFRRCLELGECERYKGVAGTGSFLAWHNLGVFYHVFGEDAAARECLGRAAAQGYEPAARLRANLPG